MEIHRQWGNLVGNLEKRRLPGRHPWNHGGDRFPGKLRIDSSHYFQKGALPRPVRSDQTDDLADPASASSITLTIDPTSVDLNSFLLDYAGADGIFDNADDMAIAATSISVPAANPQSAIFDLTGVMLADGNYRVTLKGSGNTPILDLGGNILDGEFLVTYPPSGDGVQGGDFIRKMDWGSVGGILHQGGTIIGTARCPEFRTREGRRQAAKNLIDCDIDRLVVIGGDEW